MRKIISLSSSQKYILGGTTSSCTATHNKRKPIPLNKGKRAPGIGSQKGLKLLVYLMDSLMLKKIEKPL